MTFQILDMDKICGVYICSYLSPTSFYKHGNQILVRNNPKWQSELSFSVADTSFCVEWTKLKIYLDLLDMFNSMGCFVFPIVHS